MTEPALARLLLDEIFSPVIANALRELGQAEGRVSRGSRAGRDGS
jgi:hypothetical protein